MVCTKYSNGVAVVEGCMYHCIFTALATSAVANKKTTAAGVMNKYDLLRVFFVTTKGSVKMVCPT